MDEILARLERIERRLDGLEGRPVRAVVAPPVDPSPPAPLPRRGEGGSDLEAALGARWLPRAGAVAVIGAIAYLVGLGLQRGFVTPASVAVGIAFLCVAVAVLGARTRGPKEGLGNVLVGLGAGGLYVDAVGSNLYHEMLRGEAMVASCVAISLATLGFGARRALPSFLGIGLFGGLLAAMMPLSKGLSATPVALFFLASGPAFAVCAARRWALETMAVWGACALASLGYLLVPGPLALRLMPFDAALLLGVGAWAFAAERPLAFDSRGVFPFVAAATTGLTSFSAWNGVGGVAHVASLGLAVGAIGLAFRARETGRLVGLAGLAMALVVAPMGLHFYRIPLALAGLAVAESFLLGGLGRRRAGTSASGGYGIPGAMIAAQAALAVGIYAWLLLLFWSQGNGDLPAFQEEGLIVVLAASAVAAALMLGLREARIGAGVAIWGLATRLAILSGGLPQNAAITAIWLAVFAGFLGIGFALRRPELRQLGLVVAAATAAKVVVVDLSGLDAALKAAVLMGLGLVLLGGGYAYVRWAGSSGTE